MTAQGSSISSWFGRHRKRLAPLVFVGGALWVGFDLLQAAPRSTRFRLAMGPDRDRIREAVVEFRSSGELIKAVSLRYPRGAPATVMDRVELASGEYEMVAHVRGEHAYWEGSRRFTVPAESRIGLSIPSAPKASGAREVSRAPDHHRERSEP